MIDWILLTVFGLVGVVLLLIVVFSFYLSFTEDYSFGTDMMGIVCFLCLMTDVCILGLVIQHMAR